MAEVQVAERVERMALPQAWDIFGSCDRFYWNRKGHEKRGQVRASFADEPRAVVTARVRAPHLSSALAALRALPAVCRVGGWVASGDDAHILLSVADPLPRAEMEAIFAIKAVLEIEPDRERTAAAYFLDESLTGFDPVCARPEVPNQPPLESPYLEEQKAILGLHLPTVSEAAKAHVVAVLDDGVEWKHPYVSGHLWVNAAEMASPACDGDLCGYVNDCIGWNFYDSSPDPKPYNFWKHGTHLAGLVIAVARSASAPVNIMPVRTDGPACRLSLTNLSKAIDYACQHRAGTIVLAKVWWLKDMPDPAGEKELTRALTDAASGGTLVICAGGNSCADIRLREIEPARSGLTLNNVLTVLGAGSQFEVSNRVAASDIDKVVVGPAGTDVRSISTSGKMKARFGATSAATAIIAGASAVIAAARRTSDPAQRKQLLLQCRNPKATDLVERLFDCKYLPP